MMKIRSLFQILLIGWVLLVVSACATLLGPETETEVPASLPPVATVETAPTQPAQAPTPTDLAPSASPVETPAAPEPAGPTPMETARYLPTVPGEPPAAPGSVSGNICYPSEAIPPMMAYFVNTVTGLTAEMPVAENQTTYTIHLPQGTYIAYAWLLDESLGGSYSAAVPCGLSVDCTDHAPLEFQVLSGRDVSGIDICDWYGGPDAVPQP